MGKGTACPRVVLPRFQSCPRDSRHTHHPPFWPTVKPAYAIAQPKRGPDPSLASRRMKTSCLFLNDRLIRKSPACSNLPQPTPSGSW
ncbi:hypothetical protein M407DRAFT_240618 [Tulasnella calospora MUT 4182]|uniref:Uncharacterized protein n=1 Tax=Tulasnella calospora MUT 4182 TaxID=1051891 RepID=A0A0C3QYF8_9AGAM|nr:hypothetical protein M407DRAFT_240618 [Tulasnella calospora MUT 4182]